ncbi:hypothetical protein Hanom_Chr04g00326661 [Helianthus anomalus]
MISRTQESETNHLPLVRASLVQDAGSTGPVMPYLFAIITMHKLFYTCMIILL